MPSSIVSPDPTRGIVTDTGQMQDAFYRFINELALTVPFVGTGSPEGVVDGDVRQLYMDDTGGAGAVLYIKRDSDIGGDKTKGWILV